MSSTIRKADIQDENDIQILVNHFYDKVRKDNLLAPVFSAVIVGDWTAHLQQMCDFWSSILLFSRKYLGDPMPKHLRLPIAAPHFERWLSLFHETVDEYFVGDVAEVAKTRSKSIARLMQSMKSIQSVPKV